MPKSYGSLAGEMFSLASLDKAFDAAVKGCGKNDDVIEAKHHKEEIVSRIHREIQEMTWQPGPYRQFETKKEAKRRIVDEPPFCDRVVHHAIKDNVEHFFTKKFIYASFAVTKGKGQHRAAKLVQHHIRDAMIYGEVYVAQLDIKSYYASIDQEILIRAIRRTIRDKAVMEIWERIIRSFHRSTGIGIPIGAVVSQLSANIYLNAFDHWIKEELGIRRYIRYMDDMVFLANNKKDLWEIYGRVEKYLEERLHLRLNPKSKVYKANQGVDFCGYRIFWNKTLPRKRNVKAARIRFRKMSRMFRKGTILLDYVQPRVQSFIGYMKHCDGHETTKSTLKYLVLKKGE